MKLVNFESGNQDTNTGSIGVLSGDNIYDIPACHAALLADKGYHQPEQVAKTLTPPDMVEFLRMGKRAFEAARVATSPASRDKLRQDITDRQLVHDRSEVSIRSPLPRPNSIKDCSVYEEHLLNCRDLDPGSLPDAYYQYPLYYKGNPDAVVHPGEEVIWPTYTDKLDFELEIAAVVGTKGRNIPATEAENYIAGYTIFNDFSARDVQAETKPVMMGPSKSKDFANGFGPTLVTTDDIDPTALDTRVLVNGEVWSEGDTSGMTHSWGDIIEHISEGVTIHPGDVIGSGTIPMSCSLELDRWVDPGDRLSLEVSGIGVLEHTIVADDS